MPVALTVQVDSIKKHGKDDSVIPANVAEAVNFYQPGGMAGSRISRLATHLAPEFWAIIAFLIPASCRLSGLSLAGPVPLQGTYGH